MTEHDAVNMLRDKIGYGYSQKMLAADAGVSPAFVNAVIRGHKKPSPRLLDLVGVIVTRHYTNENGWVREYSLK